MAGNSGGSCAGSGPSEDSAPKDGTPRITTLSRAKAANERSHVL